MKLATSTAFQFLKGSIKSRIALGKLFVRVAFQFLKGSIKSAG